MLKNIVKIKAPKEFVYQSIFFLFAGKGPFKR
jgi:hypothetical protein